MVALTVIIPSYNRAALLQSTVQQFLAQRYKDYELLVVDQSEGADADANAAFFGGLQDRRVQYLRSGTRGPSAARNIGLARARGEIVLFTDDDVILLTDGFIDAHLRCYDDPTVGGVTGRHIERTVRENSRRTACHVSLSGRTIFNLFGTERQEVGSCKGSNMSFRMAAVRQVGGFDRRTHMLEETDFSVRIAKAGWRLMFEPEAELVHLSTPAGGTREGRGLPTESRRFRSTAYFVTKHRGFVGRACFLGTFTLIALHRTLRTRRVSTFGALLGSAWQGFTEARQGPDQDLPSSVETEKAAA